MGEGGCKHSACQAARVAYVVATVGVLLPYLAGYLFELVIIAPLAVDAEEMPILFPLQVRPVPPPPRTRTDS